MSDKIQYKGSTEVKIVSCHVDRAWTVKPHETLAIGDKLDASTMDEKTAHELAGRSPDWVINPRAKKSKKGGKI